MISAYTGFPGASKTTMLAHRMLSSLEECRRFERKGINRTIYTNITPKPHIIEKYGKFINIYTSLNDMPNWSDCDIFIDELAVYFNSRKWESMSDEMMAFINLHRHQRVNIYGAVQDFTTVDINFRRKVQHLYMMSKILSTPEPNPYGKPMRYPWVWAMRHKVKEEHYDLEKHHYKDFDGHEMFFFTKKHFDVFDTHETLNRPTRFLTKEVLHCPEDGHKKTIYHITQ